MSLNLASPFSPFPSFVLGTGLTFVGLLGFARPLAMYDAFGIARPPAGVDPNPFSYAKSARDLAAGALFILLETYQEGSGNEDAVTALFAVTSCVCVADWWTVRRMGGKGPMGMLHLGSGIALGAFAIWRFLY
ncbi:uncharacterized protein LY79DRAFT_672086 [Colletotrichum navitas]|uniref:Uncharacterized protein n=1 Tax=Colletotrichum navitas TaxID=681940 RepID=A0AAD8V1R3_9PEZI|nr:uncharacterized protein LY79DRAFT_672086 [Colletotrichum navitas]KAK1580042.1 hypothetical protein LY79DRAFT_672086 [Colletotrichum navitas]